MPEIAEVELVRRGLQALDGSLISRVEILDAKLEELPVGALEGRRVLSCVRHGKLLGLELDNGEVLSFHLRMTGNLLLESHAKARLRLHFEPAGCLSLVDPRRFGTVVLSAAERFGETAGPDLFDEDLTAAVLAARAGRSRRSLKAVLLDQQVLAGVGNYMADEALWQAKLDPVRPATTLSRAEWRRVLAALRRVAAKALERGGASFSDYRRADGARGEMQEAFKAYGRAGEPCLRCGRSLAKTIVGGRGTTYCQHCQS